MTEFDALARSVRAELGEGPSSERRAALGKEVAKWPVASQKRARTQLWARGVLFGALAVGAVQLVLGVPGKGAPEGAPLAHTRTDSWLEAKGAPERLDFEDGTVLTLADGGRGRLVERREQLMELELARGTVDSRVTPETGTSWVILAGPFSVEVVGTVFRTEWDPMSEELNVSVSRGKVRVRGGPLKAEGLLLEAGESLEANGSKVESRFTLRSASEQREEEESSAGDDAKSGADKAESEVQASSPPAAVQVSWKNLVQEGKHQDAVKRVEVAGVEAVLTAASAAELKQLADSARYSGRSDLARRVLQTLRDRHSGSSQAVMAAFVLGRMAADGGDASEADRWFATYLREAPRGALAMEALGRRLQVSPPGVRKSLARKYLEKYPEGPRAATARALVGER